MHSIIQTGEDGFGAIYHRQPISILTADQLTTLTAFLSTFSRTACKLTKFYAFQYNTEDKELGYFDIQESFLSL